MITRRFSTTLLLILVTTPVWADPCGMVPPVYVGEGVPIVRIGEQQTYVFFKDDVETFVIRPGFSGKVDEFGMLIPFPTPPAIRKVPDHIFPHLAAAIDPPEVVIDLHPVDQQAKQANDNGGGLGFNRLGRDEVRVLRQEAVGMYEVAVLEAGSAAALKRWMDQNGYRYPEGMDKVCEEYVEEEWCFVAVKTKVGQKKGVDPKPGQRTVNPKLPAGSAFDGHVQAMGFRFKTDELVVPMRLSAFNEGELRNIVYILTDGPRKIRSIPEEYVVRQISGDQLFKNVTDPLPVRIIGGGINELRGWDPKWMAQRRDPEPTNGAAKELFASDLLAVSSGELSLPHEELEKQLLAVGEHFGLRGPDVDALNAAALKTRRDDVVRDALASVKAMTLTVVDGDFPREVLAGQNLTFAEYKMPHRRNSPKSYDAKSKGPAAEKQGVLKLGQLRPVQQPSSRPSAQLVAALTALLIGIAVVRRRRKWSSVIKESI